MSTQVKLLILAAPGIIACSVLPWIGGNHEMTRLQAFGIFTIIVLLPWLGYIIPSAIAVIRSHPRTTPIIALNLIAGWTVIGYVGAFVWALTVPRPIVNLNLHQASDVSAQLERLHQLRTQGILTEAEFELQKAKLLAT